MKCISQEKEDLIIIGSDIYVCNMQPQKNADSDRRPFYLHKFFSYQIITTSL
jgi:hypothetical protein